MANIPKRQTGLDTNNETFDVETKVDRTVVWFKVYYLRLAFSSTAGNRLTYFISMVQGVLAIRGFVIRGFAICGFLKP